MSKKLLCILFAVSIAITALSCTKKVSDNSEYSGTSALSDATSGDSIDSGDSTTATATTGKGNTTSTKSKTVAPTVKGDYVTKGGITQASVDSNIINQSTLAKKNYGGKSFKFYYWYEPNEMTTRKVNAFNDAHNAKITIVTPSGKFQENIATSIASGQPYDLIANHAAYFPQTIFANLYEPLQSYIKDVDYFNSAKPDQGGLSKTVNDYFTWSSKLYAAGSAKSVYQYVMYYNKKMFSNAGLEDPYTLWKSGKWTYSKMMSMASQATDIASNSAFLNWPDLQPWLTVNGVSAIKKQGQSYSENLGDAKVMNVINKYRDLAYGDNPVSIASNGITAFNSGFAYASFSVSDAYSVIAKTVRQSSAFGRDAKNLGVVPVPTGLCADGKYPGHAAQGYSSAKGAKDPSIAACYALFESRISDSNIGSDLQMPSEIRNYVEKEFSKNGFLGFLGMEDSEKLGTETVINNRIGLAIRNGGDVISIVEAQRPVLKKIISDTLANAK